MSLSSSCWPVAEVHQWGPLGCTQTQTWDDPEVWTRQDWLCYNCRYFFLFVFCFYYSVISIAKFQQSGLRVGGWMNLSAIDDGLSPSMIVFLRAFLRCFVCLFLDQGVNRSAGQEKQKKNLTLFLMVQTYFILLLLFSLVPPWNSN